MPTAAAAGRGWPVAEVHEGLLVGARALAQPFQEMPACGVLGGESLFVPAPSTFGVVDEPPAVRPVDAQAIFRQPTIEAVPVVRDALGAQDPT
jgi:hypothetical protein